jgi:hypothetical protein
MFTPRRSCSAMAEARTALDAQGAMLDAFFTPQGVTVQ